MNLRRTSTDNQNGYTAVELLVVLGILVLIAGLGLFLSLDSYRSSNFNAGTDAIRVSLQRARSRAVNNIAEKPHGVKIIDGNYVIFRGSTYNPADPNNEIITGVDGFTFTGPDEIVFEQLSGKVSTGAGDIIVTDGSKTATISINIQGRIN